MPSEPFDASGLAGRYATALFALADDRRELDAVAADLAAIAQMIDQSADLRRLIRSPVIARDAQARALESVLAAARIGELAQHFVGLVAKNRRLFALPAMIGAYGALLARRRGEATAEVVSATPLSARQLETVTEALKSVTGGKVQIAARVDPSLIGGLVVRLGSRMVDSSLRTKLEKLQLTLKGAA